MIYYKIKNATPKERRFFMELYERLPFCEIRSNLNDQLRAIYVFTTATIPFTTNYVG